MAATEAIHFRRSVQLDQVLASRTWVRVNLPSILQEQLSLSIALYTSPISILANSGSVGEKQ